MFLCSINYLISVTLENTVTFVIPTTVFFFHFQKSLNIYVVTKNKVEIEFVSR